MSVVAVERKCPMCKTVRTINFSEDGLIAWQSGMKIQHAFPDTTAGEREFLLTGICDPCWDKMWAEPDGA